MTTGTSPNAAWDLIQRYDSAIPRYTSYPTVPAWGPLDAADGAAALSRAAARPGPLSVYVHLPFCARMCLYCGCTTVITKNPEPIAKYLDTLLAELDLVHAALGRRPHVQLHFGGGTPTLLSPEQLRRLIVAIDAAFPPLPHAERSIEIDPVVTTRQHFETLRQLGVNRISLGVQDFSAAVQETIERRQSREVSHQAFATARELEFTSINLDLMYGLPGQTVESVSANAAEAAALGADRIALFGYAHVPWMRPHQRRLQVYGLPDARSRWEMSQAAAAVLLARGYAPIGMDHFARPGDELVAAARAGRLQRNFQGYTALAPKDLVGLGMSAIGDVGDAFVQNDKRLSAYRQRVAAGSLPTVLGLRRTAEDDRRRALISELMCNLRLDFAGLRRRLGIDVPRQYRCELDALAPLVADGIVTSDDDGLTVTELGRPLVRHVAARFDTSLGAASDASRYSKSI